MVRRVRWYFVLPQVGQRRNPWFAESAPATRLVTFGCVFSSAIPGAFFSSAGHGAVATASRNFTEPDDL
jgi:hypothetical protein